MSRARKGMTKAQVEECLGARSRLISEGEPEIWAYDLGRVDHTFYSIRIAFTKGCVFQSYVGLEPCDASFPPVRNVLPWQRLAGMAAVMASMLLGYLGVFAPIADAMHHRTESAFFTRFTIVIPALLTMGLAFTILGDRTSRLLVNTGRLAWMELALLLVLVVLGLLLFLWVDHVVESYAFQF